MNLDDLMVKLNDYMDVHDAKKPVYIYERNHPLRELYPINKVYAANGGIIIEITTNPENLKHLI